MLGLTGGIASGKSTVSARLRELGAFVADADIEARRVMEDPAVLRAIGEEFGPGVFAEDGSLDRRALAAAAFATEEGTRKLNAITHPAILNALIGSCREAEESGEYPLAVIDAALLIESGAHLFCSGVWLVTSGLEERIARIMLRDGLTRQEALARIARQLTDDEKYAYATRVIENNGTLEELITKTDIAFAEELFRSGGGLI